jgi:hypothetical protein
MTRARSSIVAAALLVAGLAGPNARAQYPPPANNAPGMATPPAPAASAEPERGPIREFFHRLRTQGKKTPRSGHSDWTTGGDSKLSKPWLR